MNHLSARDDHAGRPVLLSVAGVVGVVALFLITAAAFVVPWGMVGDEGDEVPVSRYARFADGQASLVRRTNEAGELVEWSSDTVEVVPGLRALSDLPRSFIDSVAEHIAGEGAGSNEALEDRDALGRVRVGIVSRRILKADASTATEIEVRVLDRRGLYLLGSQALGSDQSPTLIDPPLPLLPADPQPDTAWSAEGLFGATRYRWEAVISAVGPLSVELGQFEDCISVSGTLTFDLPDGPAPTELLDQFCAGVGWVHGEVGGSQPGRFDAVSVGGRAPVALPDPAGAGPDPLEPPADDPGSWQLTRVGSALPLASVGAATFSPVYLPTDPPTVLAATEAGGDLVALAAGGLAGNVVWRFPTSGAVYAQPRYDPETNRIYVGASDGVLRALDARGLFLWSSTTGDNIATRPVVANGTVVFGSEDGHIYGLDADTGGPLWRVAADGAVVSSPAVHGGLVVVADESGVVRALDPLDGNERWTHTAASAVEAPIATCDLGVLVADRSGALTLLDDGGVEIWSADAGAGLALRTEPAVVGDLVVTVDELGDVAATSLVDGHIAWRRRGEDHIGTATAAGGGILLAREDGSLDIVVADGSHVSRFDAADASTPSDFTPESTYGPSPGGGALWMADDRGIVRRLGPAAEGTGGRLEVAWLKTMLDPPYAGQPLVSTPVTWGDRLVLSDPQRNLYAVDPATGEAVSAGTFGRDGDIVLPDAVVVGDTMILDVKVRLIAVDLSSGAELWSQPLDGQRAHPPVVADGTAVTVTSDGDGAAVVAFDLADGEPRWRRATGAAALRSGPVLGDGVVLVGDPPAAFDIDTGEPLWTSTIGDPAGLPVVVDGVLVVTTYVDEAASGRLAGIDTATGAVLWERETVGDGHGPTSRLVAAGDVVALTSLSGPVIGIDPATGAELWRQRLPGPLIGNPSAIADRFWYALQSGQVVALGPADGAVQLGFEGLGTSIGAVSLVQRPVAIGDVVVIAAGTAVYAVREAPP
jgi:outer membrane protein assembly factor BamB